MKIAGTTYSKEKELSVSIPDPERPDLLRGGPQEVPLTANMIELGEYDEFP